MWTRFAEWTNRNKYKSWALMGALLTAVSWLLITGDGI